MKTSLEPGAGRMPRWMARRISCGGRTRNVLDALKESSLNTVCTSAKCPNRGECFSRGTATFMILGDICTRNCRFCAVTFGIPGKPEEDEPERVASAASTLGLEHVVVTSVTRDDLPDGGAVFFERTIRALRENIEGSSVEVLTPDFAGDKAALDRVLDASPEVFNHNVETVERLYADIRPGADYERSLLILSAASERGIFTKSGFMVGLGESFEEILDLLSDLRHSGCCAVTIGQYLRPSGGCVPVRKFYEPSEFEALEIAALEMGFTAVAAGPFVRSSYRARELLNHRVVEKNGVFQTIGQEGMVRR